MKQKYIKLSLKTVNPYLTNKTKKKKNLRGGFPSSASKPSVKRFSAKPPSAKPPSGKPPSAKPVKMNPVDFFFNKGEILNKLNTNVELENYIQTEGNKEESAIGKITSGEFNLTDKDNQYLKTNTCVSGKILKIETTQNIKDVYLLVSIGKLAEVFYLPTEFTKNIISLKKLKFNTLTLMVDGDGDGDSAKSNNLANETKNLYLEDKKSNDKLTTFVQFKDYMEKNNTGDYHFMKYITICYLKYDTRISPPFVELDSFGYRTLGCVMRAEKLYITKKQKKKIKLLGLRMAAVCNLITNSIFNESSFELLDAFQGPKIDEASSFDIYLESEHLEYASIIIQLMYLKTLNSLKTEYKISDSYVSTISFPNDSIPAITIYFNEFFIENRTFYNKFFHIHDLAFIKSLILSMVRKVYTSIVANSESNNLDFELRNMDFEFIIIYKFIYHKILETFSTKQGQKNIFLDKIKERFFSIPSQIELDLITTFCLTDNIFCLKLFDLGIKYLPEDIRYEDLPELTTVFSRLKKDLTKFKGFVDVVKKTLYDSCNYILFVLNEVAKNSYERNLKITSINRVLNDIQKSRSYYSLYATFLGGSEDLDYKLYFHTIA